MLHVLPAEVNAVYFEDRLEMLDQPRRLLADEVVSQLERLDRLRLFLLGYICGLIVKDVRDEPGNVHTVWVLTLPADYGDDKDRGEAEQWQLTPAGRTGQLLEALTTFSFLGQDQARPSVYFHPIPYERVQQAVERLLDADARRRVEAGTAGQRLEHANRRNLIAALRGQAHEVASLAAARIDRLAEAQDVLYTELAELQAVTRGQEARLAADLYSVFVLTLQKERAEMEKVIGEQIVIVTGPTKSKSWRRGRR